MVNGIQTLWSNMSFLVLHDLEVSSRNQAFGFSCQNYSLVLEIISLVEGHGYQDWTEAIPLFLTLSSQSQHMTCRPCFPSQTE